MLTQQPPHTHQNATRSTITVAIQGEVASYHDLAAIEYFGDHYRPLACDTFAEVFTAVVQGQADYGLVATENSTYGPIAESQALLQNKPVEIIGEKLLPIHHCLIGFAGVTPAQITDVYSNPIALAQCKSYLRALRGVQLHSESDTAGSLVLIKQKNQRQAAAIASAAAAAYHNLEILARNIEDNPDNCTRFIAFRAIR